MNSSLLSWLQYVKYVISDIGYILYVSVDNSVVRIDLDTLLNGIKHFYVFWMHLLYLMC